MNDESMDLLIISSLKQNWSGLAAFQHRANWKKKHPGSWSLLVDVCRHTVAAWGVMILCGSNKTQDPLICNYQVTVAAVIKAGAFFPDFN